MREKKNSLGTMFSFEYESGLTMRFFISHAPITDHASKGSGQKFVFSDDDEGSSTIYLL